MHSAVVVSSTHEPIFNFFLRTSPHLHNCHPHISSTAMLARSPNLCACCTRKKVIFFPPCPTKILNKVFVDFLGTSQETPSRVVALQGSSGGDGMWEESFVQGATGSLIAPDQCNSPSKECLSPSLSLWPSRLPKHLGHEIKKKEVSIQDP